MKSAYYMQMKRSREEKEGESSLGGRDRKFLWFLSLPPKVKSFMWRNCLGILPTNELLWKRHMRFDGVCPGCTGLHDGGGNYCACALVLSSGQ